MALVALLSVCDRNMLAIYQNYEGVSNQRSAKAASVWTELFLGEREDVGMRVNKKKLLDYCINK